MQLAYTILYVPDVPPALTFYEQAFLLKRRFLHDSNDYGELETGTTRLSFASHALIDAGPFSSAVPDARGATFEIAFVTDDVDAAVQRAVSAGAELVSSPIEKPWGQIVAYVRDPFGFLVELCTAPARERPGVRTNVIRSRERPAGSEAFGE